MTDTSLKPKRPFVLWLTGIALAVLTVLALLDVYTWHQILVYYSIENAIWTQYRTWFDLLTAALSPIAILLLFLRRAAGRWLAIAIMVLNVAELFRNALFVRPPTDLEQAIGYAVSFAIFGLPSLFLSGHLLFSRRVSAYFGPNLSTERKGIESPPPPPTFDH